MKENKITYEILNKEIYSVFEELKGIVPQDTVVNICIVFILLRRIDFLLRPYNALVAKINENLVGRTDQNGLNIELAKAADGKLYYNKSGLDFDILLADENNFPRLFSEYLDGFSPLMKEIFEGFELNQILFRLNNVSVLYKTFSRFCTIDLNEEIADGRMLADYVFKLAQRKEENGMLLNDKSGIVDSLLSQLVSINRDTKGRCSVYDPTCGSCHTLLMTKNKLGDDCDIYGQDLDKYAIALTKTIAILAGEEDLINNIQIGNTLINDAFVIRQFDYIVANIPLGIGWKDIYREIQAEVKRQNSRFFAGLPTVGDSQFLFIQHIISKMSENGRACFLTNESPLFVGSPQTAENRVRKYIVENDMLDCLVYLHSPLRDTRINTVIWVVDKNKPSHRKGKVQIINVKDNDIDKILQSYRQLKENTYSHIIPNNMVGEYDVTVSTSQGCKIHVPVPAEVDIDDYFSKEILPYIDPFSKIDYSRILRDYTFHIDDYDDIEIREPSIIKNELAEMELQNEIYSPMVSEPLPDREYKEQQKTYSHAVLGILMEQKNANEELLPGDVLIKINDGHMHVFKDGEDIPSSKNLYIIVKPKEMLLPEYLVLYSQTRKYKHDLEYYSTSFLGFLRVTFKNFMRMRIPLPSLEEQKRIIEIDQHLYNKIELIRRQTELMEEYRLSVMEYSINSK